MPRFGSADFSYALTPPPSVPVDMLPAYHNVRVLISRQQPDPSLDAAEHTRWKQGHNVHLLRRFMGPDAPPDCHLVVTDASVRQPSDEYPTVRSGYAWRRFSRSFFLLEESSGCSGTLACSFTAECHALYSACETLVRQSTADLPSLVFLTDSQSLLESLLLGPCASSTPAEVQRIWWYLLQLASHRSVTFVFVHAHCNFSLHDGVNALA